MKKIILSLPSNPTAYKVSKYSWSQNCYFIYNSLIKKYKNRIIFVPYSQMQKYKYDIDDILITTSGGYPDTIKKIIIIAPSNFITTKWTHGSYIKYGYNINFMPPTNIYDNHIKRCSSFIAQTNDVAIDKWNANHEDVIDYKNWYIDNNINIKLMQHPIDKSYYSSFKKYRKHIKPKMLVYHGDLPKDATAIINLLKKIGYSQGLNYDVVNHINMQNIEYYLNEYSIFSHTSFSEGFPYLVNEFFTAGMPVICTDEWWNGYGENKFMWSYDPEKEEKNIYNLNFLLNENNIENIYNLNENIWSKHMNRTDNDWDYFNSILINEIESLS